MNFSGKFSQAVGSPWVKGVYQRNPESPGEWSALVSLSHADIARRCPWEFGLAPMISGDRSWILSHLEIWEVHSQGHHRTFLIRPSCKWCMVSWIIPALWDVHVIIPATCECFLMGQNGLGTCDWVKELEIGGLCWVVWVGPLTRVLFKGRQENQSQSKRSERVSLEDAMLLALKVEKGVRAEECRKPLEAGWGKEVSHGGFRLLTSAWWNPLLTSDLQN